MNKKGFTLVELMAIIIIISIVATITLSVLSDKIKTSKQLLYNDLIEQFEKAGEKYMLEHPETDKYHLNTLCINLTALQESGYLEKGNIKNPKTRENMTGFVKVTYDNQNKQYEYQFTETCTSNMVTPLVENILKNEEVKVVGTTDGLYETTDSYVFRGTNPNNYLSLNGTNNPEWRIVSIDKETNMVKVIRLKDNQVQYPSEGLFSYLNSDYDSGTTYNSFKNYINPNSKWNTGIINKLDTALSIKSSEKQKNDYKTISLLSVGDYIDASLNASCYLTNDCSSYLTTSKEYWLLNTTSDSKRWYVDNNVLKTVAPTNQLKHIYPVLYLTVNASFSGNGTSTNPYK